MSDDDRRTFGYLVDVTLTDLEIKAQLERNADIDRKMIEIKGQKALANSDFNGDLKVLRKEQETLLTSINTGKTKIEVQCYNEKDERRGMMLTMRADNGFIVDERALTADELREDRQGSLFDDGTGPTPAVEAGGDDQEEAPDADAAASLEEYTRLQGQAQAGAANQVDGEDEEEDDADDHDHDPEAASEELPH